MIHVSAVYDHLLAMLLVAGLVAAIVVLAGRARGWWQ